MLLFILFSSPAFSAQISQVKGNKALVTGSDSSFEPGSEYYAVGTDGKKRALVKVSQTRGEQVVVEILKGTAQPGYTLEPRAASTNSASSSRVQEVPSEDAPAREDRAPRPRGFLRPYLKRGTSAGFMAGLSQNSMTAAVTSSQSVTMKGSNYNFFGFYDYQLSSDWSFNLKAGLDFFKVSGTASSAICDSSKSCYASFTYLATDAYFRYNFSKYRKWRPFAQAGGAFQLFLSKSSSAIKPVSAYNNMVLLGGGANYSLGQGAFIPISAEFGKLINGQAAEISTYLVSLGYGWRF